MFPKIYNEKKGQDLINQAKKLGVETEDIFPTREIGAGDVANARLQERVRSAKNARYAKLSWIIALVATLASVISAVTAWSVVERGTLDVSQKVFGECFDYYANIDPEKGIDNSLIQLCKDKATEWRN